MNKKREEKAKKKPTAPPISPSPAASSQSLWKVPFYFPQDNKSKVYHWVLAMVYESGSIYTNEVAEKFRVANDFVKEAVQDINFNYPGTFKRIDDKGEGPLVITKKGQKFLEHNLLEIEELRGGVSKVELVKAREKYGADLVDMLVARCWAKVEVIDGLSFLVHSKNYRQYIPVRSLLKKVAENEYVTKPGAKPLIMAGLAEHIGVIDIYKVEKGSNFPSNWNQVNQIWIGMICRILQGIEANQDSRPFSINTSAYKCANVFLNVAEEASPSSGEELSQREQEDKHPSTSHLQQMTTTNYLLHSTSVSPSKKSLSKSIASQPYTTKKSLLQQSTSRKSTSQSTAWQPSTSLLQSPRKAKSLMTSKKSTPKSSMSLSSASNKSTLRPTAMLSCIRSMKVLSPQKKKDEKSPMEKHHKHKK